MCARFKIEVGGVMKRIQKKLLNQAKKMKCMNGGRGGIRTPERRSGRIYSPHPLATWIPYHKTEACMKTLMPCLPSLILKEFLQHNLISQNRKRLGQKVLPDEVGRFRDFTVEFEVLIQ